MRTTCMLTVLMAIVSVGCDDSVKQTVTGMGTVTVDGSPLSGAVITLEPISGTTGPNVSTPVFDGKFSVSEEAALHGGKYRIRVSMIPTSLRSDIPADEIEMPPDDAVIAPAYDTNSQLTWDLRRNVPNRIDVAVEFLH